MKIINAIACAVALIVLTAHSHTSIDAVYFAQTHVQKTTDPYFSLNGDRDVLIKVHVVDPAAITAPAVSALLTLDGDTQNLTLMGPATLPKSIADGPGVVQHSDSNTFTAIIPASWVKPGLQIFITAGTAQTTINNLAIGAPTKVIMTMNDVHFFSLHAGDYSTGWEEELEVKWPVSELEVRRLRNIVFPELVMQPREGAPAARVVSESDYETQTGVLFNGENSSSTAWNVALRRAAGRQRGYSLYYLSHYGTPSKGFAGGFSGVGNGTDRGLLHHELGHALSLPHWGNSSSYPYKGDQHGIPAPNIFEDTHAGPTWAFDLRNQAYIPPTTQTGNVGNKPVGTYKADPMQGGGSGFQEPGYLFNHFSDFSVQKMQSYLESTVVVWNDDKLSYAKWNASDEAYTLLQANDGVSFPLLRDRQVISILASVSGATQDVNMVYPPIGPYTAGLIRLFDPSNLQDRVDAGEIFAPAGGCDVSVRIIQGGNTKTYMLAASWDTSADPTSAASLITEAVNIPAADGNVTQVELLLTPDAEVNGLPANPQVLYKWTPAAAPLPTLASFSSVPSTIDATSVTMTGATAIGNSDFNSRIEYLFIETTGNSGGTSSEWQSSPVYVDENLQPSTEYGYTVTTRSGVSKATGTPSVELAVTTDATTATRTILSSGGSNSWNAGTWSAGVPTFSIEAEIESGIAAQISSAPPAWLGELFVEPNASLEIQSGGEGILAAFTNITLNNAAIYDTFGSTQSFPSIVINNGGSLNTLNRSDPRLDTRNLNGAISGNGGFSINARGLTTYRFNTTNTFTGGLFINNGQRHLVELNAPGSAGTGDVEVAGIINGQSAVIRLGANNVFASSATLRLTGQGWDNINNLEYRNRLTRLDMQSFDATVERLFLDGVEVAPGQYPGTTDTQDWIDGSGTLTVTGLPTFAVWIAEFPDVGANNAFADDSDGDGVSNGIENYLGSDPTASSTHLSFESINNQTSTFSHTINDTPSSDIIVEYLWSSDLVTFYSDGEQDANGTSVNFSMSQPVNGIVDITATASGSATDKLFFRIKATLAP